MKPETRAEKELGLLEKSLGLSPQDEKTIQDLKQSIPMGKPLTPEDTAEIRGITTSILANAVEDLVHDRRKDLERVVGVWKGISDSDVRLETHAKLELPTIRKILENPKLKPLRDGAFQELLPIRIMHEMSKYARKENPGNAKDLKQIWFTHLNPEQKNRVTRILENDLETFANALTYSDSLRKDRILPDEKRFLDLMEEQVNRRLTDGNPLESTGRALKVIYGTPLWENLTGRIRENPKAVKAVKEMLKEHEMRAKLGNG